MDLLSPELILAIAAAAGALTANVSKWVFRWIGNYVRGTPNTLDDKIYRAVSNAVFSEFELSRSKKSTDG